MNARAVGIAALGLVHEAADVQSAILDFIDRDGEPGDWPLRHLLAVRLEGIAVSLRDRLVHGWGSRTSPSSTRRRTSRSTSRAAPPRPRSSAGGSRRRQAGASGDPGRAIGPSALSFDGTEIPRLDPERRLVPIDDLPTLIELCSQLIENPEPPEDVDRCVEAISRLCDQRPADFEKQTARLAVRTGQQHGLVKGVPVYFVRPFAVVDCSWLTECVPEPRPLVELPDRERL